MRSPLEDPRLIASTARSLREATVALLDELSDDQLEAEALPRWSVADVFRHLAESDRSVVTMKMLTGFLPGRSFADFESRNDEGVEQLRGRPRHEVREDLIVWGRRLRGIVRSVPPPLMRVRVPSMLGRVTLGWITALRTYDEWVHQHDVRDALGLGPTPLDDDTRAVLAAFSRHGILAKTREAFTREDGCLEIAFTDLADDSAWRFDLSRRQYGAKVATTPDASIRTDVGTWTLVMAQRTAWRDAEGRGALLVAGDDRALAESLLETDLRA